MACGAYSWKSRKGICGKADAVWMEARWFRRGRMIIHDPLKIRAYASIWKSFIVFVRYFLARFKCDPNLRSRAKASTRQAITLPYSTKENRVVSATGFVLRKLKWDWSCLIKVFVPDVITTIVKTPHKWQKDDRKRLLESLKRKNSRDPMIARCWWPIFTWSASDMMMGRNYPLGNFTDGYVDFIKQVGGY